MAGITQLNLPGIGGGTGALTKLLGSSGFQQFMVWGVGQQLFSSILGPILEDVQQNESRLVKQTPLTPDEAAEMVVRGAFPDEAAGADEALNSGLNADRFHRKVQITGDPLPTQMLMDAYRRGLIQLELGKGAGPSVMEGIRQSRIKDEWAQTLIALQWLPLPAADAVEAVVKSQIDYAQGEQEANHNGVDAARFKILVDAAGNPPGPMQLLELLNRGLIPLEGTGPDALTVQQGIYEGRTKNKWWSLLSKLAEYLPPPRTVTALEKNGSLNKDQAAELYKKHGLSPELAAVYAQAASNTKVAKHKELAESQLLGMFDDHIISEQILREGLALLNYDTSESDLIIEYHNTKRILGTFQKSITKLHSLYIGRKVARADAGAYLDQWRVPADQRDLMLTAWDTERKANVKVLTEAQIVAAFGDDFLDQPTATADLMGLGYSEFDAWVLLSLHKKVALPNRPEPDHLPSEAAI